MIFWIMVSSQKNNRLGMGQLELMRFNKSLYA